MTNDEIMRFPEQVLAWISRANKHELGIPTRPTACTEPPWGWGPKLSPAEVEIVWQQIEAENYEGRWRRGAAEARWASQGVEKLEAGT